jgi:hypothetical protein
MASELTGRQAIDLLMSAQGTALQNYEMFRSVFVSDRITQLNQSLLVSSHDSLHSLLQDDRILRTA